jgi:hypothetical protein
MRHRDLSRNGPMAKKRREIPEKQPKLLAEERVLSIQLKIGDRLVDETDEYEVIGRPYTTAAGKNAYVRIQCVELVEQPNVIEVKTWGAHERVSMKRASADDTVAPRGSKGGGR